MLMAERTFDVDSIEWGTLEHGVIERKCTSSSPNPNLQNNKRRCGMSIIIWVAAAALFAFIWVTK